MAFPKIDKSTSGGKLEELSKELRQLELVVSYLADAKDRGERFYDDARQLAARLPGWALKLVIEAFPEKYRATLDHGPKAAGGLSVEQRKGLYSVIEPHIPDHAYMEQAKKDVVPD